MLQRSGFCTQIRALNFFSATFFALRRDLPNICPAWSVSNAANARHGEREGHLPKVDKLPVNTFGLVCRSVEERSAYDLETVDHGSSVHELVQILQHI
jgi:hypothetical protein